MCRGNDHGGRRCPGDTSEARRLRLHKNKIIKTYSQVVEATVVAPVEEPTIPQDLVENANEPVTVEQTIKDIEELQETLANTSEYNNPVKDLQTKEWLLEVDRQMIKVGLNIEYLAETEFGAPTDAEIKNISLTTETEKLKIAAEYDPKIAAAKALRDEYTSKGVRLAIEWEDELNRNLAINNFTRENYPIIRERWEALAAKNPELWEKLEAKKAEADENRKIAEAHRNTEIVLTREKSEKSAKYATTYDSELAAAYRARNEGMRKALESVGVEFAKDGDLDIANATKTQAVKTVEAVTSFYPKKWVEASNELQKHRPLKVKNTNTRAHYNHGTFEKKYYQITTSAFVHREDNWKPDPHDRYDSELEPVNADGAWVDPKSGITHKDYESFKGYKSWRSVSYDYKYSTANGKTPAGYKKVQIWKRAYNENGKLENTNELITVYRKPSTVSRLAEEEYIAELTISPEPASLVNNKASNTSVALHELAHRMERSVPAVVQMERAFLLRRAGILSSDNPDSLTRIYTGKKEMGYKDNFPSHYMGKVYNGKAYEILSMGMEAVFEGRKAGGLVGVDGEKADPDYKRAILAILATGK